MKEYEIWAEGFQDMCCEKSPASLMGKEVGESFNDACIRFMSKRSEYELKNYPLEFDKWGKPYYWACRLFDNETDARKSFG